MCWKALEPETDIERTDTATSDTYCTAAACLYYLSKKCNNPNTRPILLYILLFVANWDSVTPLPIADVDETPPVTVLMRLSA
jgi:hypothetical protein